MGCKFGLNGEITCDNPLLEGELAPGSSGPSGHEKLLHRDFPDQHPMSAITGLEKELSNKATHEELHKYVEDNAYSLPVATDSALGGVQAPAKTEDQTVSVGIGEDNKLYVAPSKEQMQSDWNQNDETAPDFIKNRVCYTKDPVESVFANEQSVVLNRGNGLIQTDKTEIKSLTKYKVIINGDEYIEESHYEAQGGVYIVGNVTGDPFGIAPGRGQCAILTTKYTDTITISIQEIYEEPIKLPEKYLPEKILKPVGQKTFEFGEIFNDYENNKATSALSHAEGAYTTASGDYSHAEGTFTTASGNYGSHAEGCDTTASGNASHAEGNGTTASGGDSHAEGSNTTASGDYSPHAEGAYTTASGDYSHAEGTFTTASGYGSHAEGAFTTASGEGSHAEGYDTTASGNYGSHAEGSNTTASGDYSPHAEGAYTTASGDYSHAEGTHTTASGEGSHAEGYDTIASGDYQHVQGKYNIDDPTNKYAHIVGNGEYGANSNAHTLDWKGNAWYQASVLVGGTDMDAPDASLLPDGVIIKAQNSTKKFKITVDDTGVIKATEV